MPGLGRGALELGDRVFLGRHDFVRRLVALRDVEPELALGQVTHMAHAGLDHISGAEKLVDRLGLLGALDDHQGRPVAVGRWVRNHRRIFAGRRSWRAAPSGRPCAWALAFSVRFPRPEESFAWTCEPQCCPTYPVRRRPLGSILIAVDRTTVERVIEIVLPSNPATIKERVTEDGTPQPFPKRHKLAYRGVSRGAG